MHKITSLVMALLLLLSTVSWTVEKHLCMGRVMDSALFHHAEDCGMKAGLAMLEDDSVLVNHCCGDEVLTLEGQDELNIDFFQIELNKQLFLISFTNSYLGLFESAKKREIVTDTYPPPNLAKDLNILYQVYLI